MTRHDVAVHQIEGNGNAVRNGLDEAIEQVERGEVDYYDNFDDLVVDLDNA